LSCLAAYDKIKAYGLYIHGIVDGGTNRVMAMTVACNKTEQAVSYGYFEACREHGRPIKTRVDKAWEAAGVCGDIRNNRGPDNHIIGRSTANQVCRCHSVTSGRINVNGAGALSLS